jgi:penicillin-binding protein activator
MTTMHAPFAVSRRLATPIGWRGSTRLLGALLLVAVVQGCNSTRVARIDPASVTDLSGRWNDADSRLVANALITQSLEGNWARQWAETHGGRTPTVIVGGFANRTMEHIPVGTFTRDLERAFVTSGAVRVVASAEERQSVRTERADQQTNAQADTRARLALEQGAQFMLQGDVQAIEDAQGRERAITYQIDATLVDLESNAKIWVGQHRIKKVIDRRRFGW